MTITLPHGWSFVNLEELCIQITDGTHKTPTYQKEGVRFISIQNLRRFAPIDWNSYIRFVSPEDHFELSKRACPEIGDVLVSKIGTLGLAKIIDFSEPISIFVGLALIKPNKQLLDSKFLEIVLNSPPYQKLAQDKARGAGRKTLPLEELRKFPIPIPYPDTPERSLAEQRRIVARLEALLGEVKALREQVQTLQRDVNRLMESALAEVFPAAGQPLPQGWGWKDMPEVCLINPKRPRIQRDDKNPTSFIPMQAVDDRTGTIIDLQLRPYGEVKRGYTYFEENDVLMAKITPSMENGKAAIARNLIDGIGFGTTEFHVFRPRSNILPEWIFYFIRRKVFRETAKMSFRGAVGQQRVPEEFLLTQKIPLPNPNDPERSLAEQRRIVAYLDGIQQTVREAQELIQSDLRAIEQLEQSILAAAFRGEV